MPYPRSRRAPAAVATLAVLLTLGLAGCGSSDDAGGTSSQGDTAAEPAAGGAVADRAGGGPAPAKQEGAKQEPVKPGEDPVAVGAAARSVVYTGTITVRVDNPDAAAASAAALVIGANGIVAADQRQHNGSRSEARLVLRVPAERFTSTLDALRGLGTEEIDRSVETQDVTEQMVDLEVRVANSQASVDRVRALMARAQTIGEIVSLESELARREADLGSLQARKRKLDDLTALSTITATLLGPDAQAESAPGGFLAGLKSGWNAFVSSMRVLLTVFGALLPWMIALGVPIAGVWWLVRRARRRNRAGGSPGIGPMPAPVPAAPGPQAEAPPAPPN